MKHPKRHSAVEMKVFLLRRCLKPAHLYQMAKEGFHYYTLRRCAFELVAAGLLQMSAKVKRVNHPLSSEPEKITQRMFTTSDRGRVALEVGEGFLALLKVETKT